MKAWLDFDEWYPCEGSTSTGRVGLDKSSLDEKLDAIRGQQQRDRADAEDEREREEAYEQEWIDTHCTPEGYGEGLGGIDPEVAEAMLGERPC